MTKNLGQNACSHGLRTLKSTWQRVDWEEKQDLNNLVACKTQIGRIPSKKRLAKTRTFLWKRKWGSKLCFSLSLSLSPSRVLVLKVQFGSGLGSQADHENLSVEVSFCIRRTVVHIEGIYCGFLFFLLLFFSFCLAPGPTLVTKAQDVLVKR